VTVEDGFSPTGNYNLIACPVISAGTTTSANVQAYVGAEAQVFVFFPHDDNLSNNNYCPLYTELSVTAGFGPTITVASLNNLNVKATATFSVPFEIGSDWLHLAKIGSWQCPWRYDATLYNLNLTLFNQNYTIVPSAGNYNWTSPDYAASSGNLSPSVSTMTNLLLLN